MCATHHPAAAIGHHGPRLPSCREAPSVPLDQCHRAPPPDRPPAPWFALRSRTRRSASSRRRASASACSSRSRLPPAPVVSPSLTCSRSRPKTFSKLRINAAQRAGVALVIGGRAVFTARHVYLHLFQFDFDQMIEAPDHFTASRRRRRLLRLGPLRRQSRRWSHRQE